MTFQIEIPETYVGRNMEKAGEWLLPADIYKWLREGKTKWYSYCGSNSSGNGYTDGVSNTKFVFIIYGDAPGDDLVFKIKFPTVKVWPRSSDD